MIKIDVTVNVLLSSVATFCVLFLFSENSFDFWYDSGKTFAKSAKSFDFFCYLEFAERPVSKWEMYAHYTRHLFEWIYRERCVGLYGPVCLSVEKITPFVNI